MAGQKGRQVLAFKCIKKAALELLEHEAPEESLPSHVQSVAGTLLHLGDWLERWHITRVNKQ